jgi:hypothetical protein
VATSYWLIPFRYKSSKQSARIRIRRSEGAGGDGLTGEGKVPVICALVIDGGDVPVGCDGEGVADEERKRMANLYA